MSRVREGAVANLAVLFERHHRALFRYFISMTRDQELAEDLVQEVFTRILRYRASYDPAQPFTTWMYQIARNTNLDHAAKRRGEIVGIEEFLDRRGEPASPDPGPEESAMRGQDMLRLRAALDRLPAEKKEILVLSRFQGMKYDELARLLHCEVGAVKVRVYRAMRALEEIYLALAGERAS